MSEIIFRDPTDEDGPYILKTWVKHSRESHQKLHVSDNTYNKEMTAAVKHLIRKVPPIIACYEEVLDEILGYICSERLVSQLVVHFIYVRKWHRNQRLASRLLEQVGYDPTKSTMSTSVETTGLMPAGKHNAYRFNITNNPYFFFRRAYAR